MVQRLLKTLNDPSIVLIRLLVGLVVFVPEGIQKFLFPDVLGAGRFAAIGIPGRRVLGPFAGASETAAALWSFSGLLTRLAAIPLIIVMIVAILSTKIPILLGHEFLGFSLPALKRYGFWSMQHEARADLCMLLGCIYLLIVGGGGYSLDARLQRKPA